MAQRTVALCDGKFIGIESIYTVVDGKQINIPDKLTALRARSRKNELFCPCGCGSNLILVASENNLREQHFRLKTGEFNKECQAVTEGKRSVDSKIILKCWLDDKLHDESIESRVPIADVSDTDRKFEFTFLSKTKAIGISYCHDRVNVSDIKLKLLADNSTGIGLVHILDACNFKADGQYPEAEMKIQDIQGYCFLLDIGDELDYFDAQMRAVFYAQNLDGLWEEVEICNANLSEFSFDAGKITCAGKMVRDLADSSKKQFEDKLQAEKIARGEARKHREAYEQEQRELVEKRRIELQKQREEVEKRWAEEAEQRRIEAEKTAEQRRLEEEKRKQEQIQAAIRENNSIRERLEQQAERVVDSKGVRWIKCEFCGLIATEGSFSSYGGANHINLGTCKECQANNPEAQISGKMMNQSKAVAKKRDPYECPQCGGRIVEKVGRYGKFLSCSNYPRCDYKPPRRW